MTLRDSAFIKFLIIYYGVIQAAHIVVLARAAVELITYGTIGFPALPPPGGWSTQARHFLIGLGLVDAINVIVAFIFVYGYFSRARWYVWLGEMTLTVAGCSAMVFAYGTISSRAWRHNLVEYLSIALVFIPVAVLIVLLNVWAVRGGFYKKAEEQYSNSA